MNWYKDQLQVNSQGKGLYDFTDLIQRRIRNWGIQEGMCFLYLQHTSASMVIGWNETLEHRLRHLDRLRQLNDEAAASHGNGFTAFIVWTAQIEDTPLGRTRLAEGMGADAEEYLRTISFARIF